MGLMGGTGWGGGGGWWCGGVCFLLFSKPNSVKQRDADGFAVVTLHRLGGRGE